MVQSSIGNSCGILGRFEFVVAVLELVSHLLGEREISAVPDDSLR